MVALVLALGSLVVLLLKVPGHDRAEHFFCIVLGLPVQLSKVPGHGRAQHWICIANWLDLGSP